MEHNMKTYNNIAIVGRFTIVHLGHENLIKQAAKRLNPGGKLTILIGSAGHYPSPKHPLPYVNREKMIHLVDVPELQEKKITLEVVPIYDFLYTPQAWTMQVQRYMASDCALLGHKKPDGSSDWVDTDFPDTDYINIPDKTGFSATAIRKRIYEYNVATNTMNINNWVSTRVMGYVQELIANGTFEAPAAEYHANRLANQKFRNHPYPDNINSLCADTVVECKGHILLGKRKGLVGKGTWALPGGHKDRGETLQETCLRELDEETNIKVPPMVLRKSIVASQIFDNPGRSETADEKVTQAFHIILDNEKALPKVRAADDLEEVNWFRLCDVKRMSQSGLIFADHAEIVHAFTSALL